MARRAWGEGALFENKNKKVWMWAGYYYDIDGHKQRKYLSAADKPILMKKVKEWQNRLVDGHIVADKSITLEKWSTQWLATIKPTVKSNTYKYYKSLINNHISPILGQTKLENLESMQIQNFLNNLLGKKGIKKKSIISATTVNKIRETIRAILNSAVENGLIYKNVIRGTKRVRGDKKKIVALSENELKAFLAVAKEGLYIYNGCKKPYKEDLGMKYHKQAYYTAIYLAATTGMRKGEVFGLEWSDINFESGVLSISHNLVGINKIETPKTASSFRNIKLASETIAVLKDWQKYQQNFAIDFGKKAFKNTFNLVFTNTVGNSISVDNFLHRYWKKICNEANTPKGFTFHGLRHTFATMLLQKVNVKVVSEILGHSDVAMTMRVYAHALPSMQEVAVQEIEKIFKENT